METTRDDVCCSSWRGMSALRTLTDTLSVFSTTTDHRDSLLQDNGCRSE